jgi:two-component system, NtrC family, response regulator HydG
VRSRVGAASVSCLMADEAAPAVVASDGVGHSISAVAARAIDSGLVIPPSSTSSGLEAAVPIRSAGAVIGALGCRWAADVTPDWSQAGVVLAAAATAAAPCLRQLLDRRSAPAIEPAPGDILGVSEAVRTLRVEIARAASAPFNVVIEGESGSGKELVARAIHRLGPRARHPLCALNCAALTDELVEAELFGHARGAFTGAVAERKGLFEEAHQGTLVLDEVGELTPRAQAKLLRVLQEGEVRRVGENAPRAVDVRIVAATNRPLRAAVDAGAFRPDLRYRLEVIRISVPPLRARVEDIPILAAHFFSQATTRLGSRCTLPPSTLAALARYDWPGNVRELQNVMASLAVSGGPRGSIGPDRLPAVIGRQAAQQDGRNLDDARRRFEAAFVRAALARAGGRRTQAAADLGVTRQGLAKLLVRLGIE